ncbi:MAG TPA: class I SAM-dependent methyltransferase [Mycobacteriales bacterium]|nr:class I SAM-dependent methyltransferase [Mycobacteriales bacterium]
MDWGAGRYETFAAHLAPAADVAVDRLAPAAGEHVVDLGCGTGNAAVRVAGRGARVTGVEPAPRLRAVAQERLARAGFADATVVAGEAAAMPLDDASADAIISVFGVIFAPDPELAAIEMARVVRPGGRIVLTAWRMSSAFAVAGKSRRDAMARATGQPAADVFPWSDEAALDGLFAHHGFTLEVQEHELVYTAGSVEEFFRQEVDDHPMWNAAATVLPPDELARLHDEALAIYVAENTDPAAFRISNGYVVAHLSRG